MKEGGKTLNLFLEKLVRANKKNIWQISGKVNEGDDIKKWPIFKKVNEGD